MAVNYVRVTSLVDQFSPVIRATGNIAIIGSAANGVADKPVLVSDPSDATTQFGSTSSLTAAIQLAFQQTPGPSQVWGVRVGDAASGAVTGPTNALKAVETLDVQFVVLAATPLGPTTHAATDAGTDPPAKSAIEQLADHVNGVSNTGGDGKERMGVAMLVKGTYDPSVVSSTLASDRMIYIAHNSDQDAAAAVAGTIAGYEPHISMLLKQVSIKSDSFTSGDIDTINGATTESDKSGPGGKGVNWLARPALIPGGGVYLGEGYTGNTNGKKFIDVQRTVDDVSFKLKARLIRSVGNLRISRTGLRSLTVQMEAVLDPLVASGVLEGYQIVIPVLSLLDADPATLTATQRDFIDGVQAQRVVEVLAAVDYAGAIHRIAITLQFK